MHTAGIISFFTTLGQNYVTFQILYNARTLDLNNFSLFTESKKYNMFV